MIASLSGFSFTSDHLLSDVPDDLLRPLPKILYGGVLYVLDVVRIKFHQL